MRIDPRAIPKQCSTLGDLAREVAALNFGKLADLGARHQEEDVWNVFLKVLNKYSRLQEADINGDTLLLDKQLRAS